MVRGCSPGIPRSTPRATPSGTKETAVKVRGQPKRGTYLCPVCQMPLPGQIGVERGKTENSDNISALSVHRHRRLISRGQRPGVSVEGRGLFILCPGRPRVTPSLLLGPEGSCPWSDQMARHLGHLSHQMTLNRLPGTRKKGIRYQHLSLTHCL